MTTYGSNIENPKYRWEIHTLENPGVITYRIVDRHAGWSLCFCAEQEFAELITKALNEKWERGIPRF